MDMIEAPLGRREKRKQEIRARIEDAAYALFKTQGIEETSIEQICVEADVARRTFYGHFPNKHALLGGLAQGLHLGALLGVDFDGEAMIGAVGGSVVGDMLLDRVVKELSEFLNRMGKICIRKPSNKYGDISRVSSQSANK